MKKTSQDHIIAAIHVTNRVKQAGAVQGLLTRYGAQIKTRIGLHETTGRKASANGLILLELVGSQRRAETLLAELNAIAGVEAQTVIFAH